MAKSITVAGARMRVTVGVDCPRPNDVLWTLQTVSKALSYDHQMGSGRVCDTYSIEVGPDRVVIALRNAQVGPIQPMLQSLVDYQHYREQEQQGPTDSRTATVPADLDLNDKAAVSAWIYETFLEQEGPMPKAFPAIDMGDGRLFIDVMCRPTLRGPAAVIIEGAKATLHENVQFQLGSPDSPFTL